MVCLATTLHKAPTQFSEPDEFPALSICSQAPDCSMDTKMSLHYGSSVAVAVGRSLRYHDRKPSIGRSISQVQSFPDECHSRFSEGEDVTFESSTWCC